MYLTKSLTVCSRRFQTFDILIRFRFIHGFSYSSKWAASAVVFDYWIELNRIVIVWVSNWVSEYRIKAQSTTQYNTTQYNTTQYNAAYNSNLRLPRNPDPMNHFLASPICSVLPDWGFLAFSTKICQLQRICCLNSSDDGLTNRDERRKADMVSVNLWRMLNGWMLSVYIMYVRLTCRPWNVTGTWIMANNRVDSVGNQYYDDSLPR